MNILESYISHSTLTDTEVDWKGKGINTYVTIYWTDECGDTQSLFVCKVATHKFKEWCTSEEAKNKLQFLYTTINREEKVNSYHSR